MPELPEVETVRSGLQNLLPGKRIASVWFDWEKSFPNYARDVDRFMIGASVVRVRRRAKVLMIDLSSEYSLVIHLKMTGQLVYINQNPSKKVTIQSPQDRFGAGHPNESLVGSLPDKSTRVVIKFADNSALYFNDQRKFGWMKLLPTADIASLDFMKKVGPEPLDADFTASIFKTRLLRRKNSRIKAVLLDQTVLAGVGNIYADESLWAAQIHPEQKVVALTDNQIKKLHNELVAVLRLSIEKGGSTDKNYVNAEGKKGSYIAFAKVFRKQDTPCQRCNSTIVKIRSAGRGTHVCFVCQRQPA